MASISFAMWAALGNTPALINAGYSAYEPFGTTDFGFRLAESDVYPFTLSSNVVGSGAKTETITQAFDSEQNTAVTLGGSATANDVVSVTVQNAELPGGQETASYTVASGNTLTNVASGLASAINADANLAAIGVGASSSSAVLTVSTDTSYTASTSGGATETVSVGANYRGNVQVTLGGKATSADTVTITAHNPILSGGSKAKTYTVGATDGLADIAAGLAAAINSDTNLQALGLSVNNSAQLAFSENFSGNAIVPSGASSAIATGVDGSSNSKTNTAQVNVQGGTGASLVYDKNGCMTSDGTNAFAWDAENRMIKITYPGSNNFSTFVYDGLGHNASIVETVGGSVISTKIFIWADSYRREARNSAGTLTAQYFGLGEKISSTNYFYTKDMLGSIREMTSTSGTIADQRSYDPFGQATQLQGSIASDFQFAGYYSHSASGLNLTTARAYSAAEGRFINRDRVAERGGINLYSHTENRQPNFADPTGLGSQYPPGFIGPVKPGDTVGNSYPADFTGPTQPGDTIGGVPVAPADADIGCNMLAGENNPGDPFWLASMVHGNCPPWNSSGPMDYKSEGDPVYENFGNFNFGAVAAAQGIPLDVALFFAGVFQAIKGTPGVGSPFTGPPFGDDPADQAWIRSGYNYYGTPEAEAREKQCCPSHADTGL